MSIKASRVAMLSVLSCLARALVAVWLCLATPAFAADGPVFSLIDQDGKAITQSRLKGKPTVLVVGFTRCPVICPTTLYEVSQQMKRLGPKADKVNFVFLTLDPERDTPEVLKAYLQSFDDRLLGVTGPEPEIRKLAAAFGATSVRVPLPDGDYTVDHSVVSYMLDSEWRPAGTIFLGHDANQDAVHKSLQQLAGK